MGVFIVLDPSLKISSVILSVIGVPRYIIVKGIFVGLNIIKASFSSLMI